MYRGTPEESGTGPWVDAVGSLRGGCIEGRQRKVAAARPDATFLWLTLPADRKKTEQVTEANWASCPEMPDWYRIFL